MSWKGKTMEELRTEFVLSASNCLNFSALCKEYNITRKTGYKWFNRFKSNESMSDKPKVPLTINNKTSPDIEQLILSERVNDPGYGARKLKIILENKYSISFPCPATINNILKRNNLISDAESIKHKPYKRFEKNNCNDMWQTDFKGQFLTNDNKYCYILDIIDDHSRFLIDIAPFTSTENVVLPTFERVFYKYGKPYSLLSDNGSQFAGFKKGYTKFEKWLMNHNVLPLHGRIKHPQTQGKIERFHRSLKNELLNYKTFNNIECVNIELQKYKHKYNYERPHEALKMGYPATIYHSSSRKYNPIVKEYQYSGIYHVLKVNSWGYIRFNDYKIYLSETMINEHVELRPNENNNSFIICYRNFIIAEIDAITGNLLNRTIKRL